MSPDGTGSCDAPQETSQSISEPPYYSSAGSTKSDSGYGSISLQEDPTEPELQSPQTAEQIKENHEATSPIKASQAPIARRPPTVNTARQRTFDGLTVFNPSQAQAQRYHEILGYITQPLNNCLKKRGRLGTRHRPRRVDAVRLIVMGTDQDSAKPYIVFFCNSDVEKTINDMLEKPAYQQIFRAGGVEEVSFCYRTVQSGITLRLFDSKYRVEVAQNEDHTMPVCGAPIRLYHRDSEEWRRATLGGVLKVENGAFRTFYYAMTAGHLFGDSSNNYDDQASDYREPAIPDKSLEHKMAGLEVIGSRADTNLCATDNPSSTSSPWDFQDSKSYEDFTIASADATLFSDSCYFDWALFKLDQVQLNYFSQVGSIGDRMVTVARQDLAPCDLVTPGPQRSVLISTASSGIIGGFLQDGMAKIVIEPGEEVVDVYIISLNDKQIEDGDSGSWVILEDNNDLIGHVVASDVLGDVYVIPIKDTLNNIRHQLKAVSVSLPSIPEAFNIPYSRDSEQRRTSMVKQILAQRRPMHKPLAISPNVADTIATLDSKALELSRRVRVLYQELEKVANTIDDLRASLKHLRFEAQDQDSLLNQQTPESSMYYRQVTGIIQDFNFSLVHFDMVLDDFHNKTDLQRPKEDIHTRASAVLYYYSAEFSNQKTTIDIFLDTIQLHNPQKVKDEPSVIPSMKQLEFIKQKVNVISLRLSLGHTSNDNNDEETLWERFSRELATEGFSSDVLEQHKDVLRAYIRELDSSGFFDRASSPSTQRNLDTESPESSSNYRPKSFLLKAKLPGLSYDSDSSSSETDDSRFRNMTLISTRDLMRLDAAAFHTYHTARSQRTMPLSTRGPLANRESPPGLRLAPDSKGQVIPLDATWTKIDRRLVSPEVVERSNLRYEARPNFIAILGVLSKAEVLGLARVSAEARRARIQEKALPTVPDLDLHSSTATETEGLDPWDSDLQAWDSDLDAWGPRIQDSSDSEPDLEVRDNEEMLPHVGLSPSGVKAKGASGGDQEEKTRETRRVTAWRHPNDLLTRREREYRSNRHRDRDRDRDRKNDRDHERIRSLNRGGDRRGGRLQSKKRALRETIGAVGIGGAAASLLSVLTEAAGSL